MDELEAWSEFNVAMVGATAALAGLVIVAASVNIKDIVQAPSLTSRLAAGIAGLVLALAVAALALVPGIPSVVYGGAVTLFALLTTPFSASATRRIYENRHPANRLKIAKSIQGFLPATVYLVGGVLVLAGAIGAGLVVFAIGSIVAIVAGLLVSWIVLVEVLR